MSEQTKLTTINSLGVFAAGDVFTHFWSVAKLFADSSLVPKHFQGKPADCMIALNIATRLGMDPLTIFQSLHVVHGAPGWSAKYLIAQMNRSDRFKGGVRFSVTGAGREMVATASIVLADTGEEMTESVSMVMAEAEGWTRNSKYQTMPAVMLRYRAATFLCRFYAPEVLLGISTADEVVDVHFAETIPATAAVSSPPPAPLRSTPVETRTLTDGVADPDNLADLDRTDTRERVRVDTNGGADEQAAPKSAPAPAPESAPDRDKIKARIEKAAEALGKDTTARLLDGVGVEWKGHAGSLSHKTAKLEEAAEALEFEIDARLANSRSNDHSDPGY